ncbi:phospholipase-like protein [Tanacetum coccineum]
MLRKQHKVDDSHYDMPPIYYTEGHSLHFGRPEFALITGLPFGTVNFGLYTSGELKFRNRVFPHKLGLSITNLDAIGVIEDEETFLKLCDQDSMRICLILALDVIFMGRLLTCPVDDTLFRIKNVIEKHSDEHYFGLKKDRMYVPTYTLSGFVFAFQVWIFKSFERCNCWWIKDPKVIPRALGWSKKSIFKRSDCCYLFAKESTTTTDIRPTIVEYESSWWIRNHVLARERNEEYGVLHFNDEFSSLGREFMDSLNILFQDLIQPHYSDEDISNDFVVEDELRLCLEDEERMLLEQEKNIIEEQRFRVEEAKRMSILGKLTHSKRNHVDIVPGKTNPTVKPWVEDLSCLFHSLDTVWLTPDIERFISQQGHVKCKFPWSDDYTLGRNFWLTLACLDPSRKGWLSEEHIDLWVDYMWHERPDNACLDPTRKGWLSEEHIDLWVDYMWHGRPDNANWAMVSCYFVQILLQNSTPLFYANGDKYATPWSDVDQVFFPINETAQHWCLAHFDIVSGLVTFYDSGDTYDYESRDFYVRVRECLKGTGSSRNL